MLAAGLNHVAAVTVSSVLTPLIHTRTEFHVRRFPPNTGSLNNSCPTACTVSKTSSSCDWELILTSLAHSAALSTPFSDQQPRCILPHRLCRIRDVKQRSLGPCHGTRVRSVQTLLECHKL